jgi:hypothetical protein
LYKYFGVFGGTFGQTRLGSYGVRQISKFPHFLPSCRLPLNVAARVLEYVNVERDHIASSC